jgi:hypothetical protein
VPDKAVGRRLERYESATSATKAGRQLSRSGLSTAGMTAAETLRRRRYGVTEPEWQELLAKHDGKCWLCLVRDAQCVDHDHETGRIRGPLCRGCNMALHYVERPGWWDRARSYLLETSGGDQTIGT